MSVLIKDLKLPKDEVLLIYSDGEVRTEDWVKYSAVEVPDDVQPVVHGKNLDRETPSIFTCSVCGWHSWDTYCGDTSEYNYCPNCGAKMDGER